MTDETVDAVIDTAVNDGGIAYWCDHMVSNGQVVSFHDAYAGRWYPTRRTAIRAAIETIAMRNGLTPEGFVAGHDRDEADLVIQIATGRTRT